MEPKNEKTPDYICDICRKKPATVQISGEGQYCLDCYNEKMLNAYGVENTFDYPKSMTVIEPNGAMHTFQIEHMVLGPLVSWDAIEQGGHYHFKESSNVEANGSATAQMFFRKIVDGVCTKSLEEVPHRIDNILFRNDKYIQLRDKGSINIVEDEADSERVLFEIDGERFRGEDLEKLFGGRQGFVIRYDVQDGVAPILKENEYLVPVYITKDSLIGEMNMVVNIYTDRKFLSYKNVLGFREAFDKVLDKLKVLADAGKRKEALAAGREMVRILTEIETDDDSFPISDMELISDIVDPFGIDEKLRNLIWDYIEGL